jgi:hypothetical protein
MITKLAQASLASPTFKEEEMPASFRVSVYKDWLTLSNSPWVNTYEFTSDTLTTPVEVAAEGIPELIADAERGIHLTSVMFDRAVVSTYGADGNPYDPETFVSVPLTGFGFRTFFTQALDINAVFKVRRLVSSGRNGKLAYRGCLIEGDVSANASGQWRIETASTLNQDGTDYLAYLTGMSTLLDGFAGVQMALLSGTAIGGGPTSSRPVSNLVVAGAGFNKKNHRWFNSP